MMHSVTPYIRNIYQGVLYSANITLNHTGNSIYSRTKRTAIPVPIIIRATMAQQHCVQVSYTKFQPNRTTDVAGAVRKVFMPLNKVKKAPLSEPQISEKAAYFFILTVTNAESVNISWTDVAFHSIKEFVISFYRLQKKAVSGSRTHAAVPLIIQTE